MHFSSLDDFLKKRVVTHFTIDDWEKRGVQFRTYMYIPEVHPITNNVFCEREDEAHVLKVQCCLLIRFVALWLHLTFVFPVYYNFIVAVGVVYIYACFQRIESHTNLFCMLLFQIIACSGGPDQLGLERFAEALAVPGTGLTYPALIGARK